MNWYKTFIYWWFIDRINWKKKQKKIIRSIIKFISNLFSNLFLVVLALISVIIIGDIFDLNPTVNTTQLEIDTKISNNKIITKRIDIYNCNKNKSFLQKYIEDKNNQHISQERFIQNTFEDIIQELISHNIFTNSRFSNLNGVNNFVENYLINKIVSGNLKITAYEFNKLMYSINEVSHSNPKLYSLLCNENKFKFDPNIKYNKVSKRYLNNYTSWVIDPYSNELPGNFVLKNKLSLMEEFEMMNNNYTQLVSDVDDIIKDINSKLNKKS